MDWGMDISGEYRGRYLWSKKKKEIICFVIYIPGERKRFFFIYEVILKKKKKNGLLITTHSFVLGTVVIKKQTPLCCGALAKSMYIVKFWTHHWIWTRTPQTARPGHGELGGRRGGRMTQDFWENHSVYFGMKLSCFGSWRDSWPKGSRHSCPPITSLHIH